nr:hypothetical protein [Streptomyces albidoflavus]
MVGRTRPLRRPMATPRPRPLLPHRRPRPHPRRAHSSPRRPRRTPRPPAIPRPHRRTRRAA